MKKLMLIVALAAVVFLPQLAAADTVTFIGNYGPYQTGSGGEFTVLPTGSISAYVDNYSALTSGFSNGTNSIGTFQRIRIKNKDKCLQIKSIFILYSFAVMLKSFHDCAKESEE